MPKDPHITLYTVALTVAAVGWWAGTLGDAKHHLKSHEETPGIPNV